MDIVDRLRSMGGYLDYDHEVTLGSIADEVEQLRAKVAELEKDLRTKEPMRAVTKIIMEDNDRLDDENTQLQAQLDAIYALPVTARIDMALRKVILDDTVAFHTPTVANIPDIELIVLPPRGEQ